MAEFRDYTMHFGSGRTSCLTRMGKPADTEMAVDIAAMVGLRG